MKRRVNIGVGLLHRPKLIYMDEPTVGIDLENAAAFWTRLSNCAMNMQ